MDSRYQGMQRRAAALAQDKRRDSRFQCTGDVTISGLGGASRVTGTVLDLSLSGCLIRPDTSATLREGELVEVSLYIDQTPIRAKGCIRSMRPDGTIGIEFVMLSDSGKWHLHELMQQLAQQWMRGSR